MHLLLFALSLCSSAPEAPDTVVVCPETFREALSPWVAYRQAQGHRLAFVSNRLSAVEIRDAIRRLARLGRLRYVVLVGDAVPEAAMRSELQGKSTPTHQVAAKINIHWGSEPEIATDNPYADLDEDAVPDLAVGRLSVQSAEQLEQLVEKILDYERAADNGRWQRRVNLVAGVGGFSPLADTVLEMATKKFIADGIPDDYETTMTYASWQSPYCPDPRRFRDVALDRMNEGCLFWVYLGHGNKRGLDFIQIPGATYPILLASDVEKIRVEQGAPVALMLACHTGAFDQPQDCLAEIMLRQPRGPVAVISGSRVTMPYAMAVMGNAMMDQAFRVKTPTLGDMFCQAKQAMVRENPQDPNRQLLDALAAAISPLPDRLAEERHEHLALFNLLGDPLLTIPRPVPVQLSTAESITGGQTLNVQGRCELAGNGVLEIVCRRDRLKVEPAPRRQFDPDDRFLRSFDTVYREANDRVWARQTFVSNGRAFELQVDVPPETRGPCYVRAWIESDSGSAQGATRVFVRHAAPAVSAE